MCGGEAEAKSSAMCGGEAEAESSAMCGGGLLVDLTQDPKVPRDKKQPPTAAQEAAWKYENFPEGIASYGKYVVHEETGRVFKHLVSRLHRRDSAAEDLNTSYGGFAPLHSSEDENDDKQDEEMGPKKKKSKQENADKKKQEKQAVSTGFNSRKLHDDAHQSLLNTKNKEMATALEALKAMSKAMDVLEAYHDKKIEDHQSQYNQTRSVFREYWISKFDGTFKQYKELDDDERFYADGVTRRFVVGPHHHDLLRENSRIQDLEMEATDKGKEPADTQGAAGKGERERDTQG